MKAKKSLGQNFLKSKAIVKDIVSIAQVSPKDTVLEIGPGKGVLTENLLECAERVIAVEKDNELVSLLKEKFSKEIKNGKLELIQGDILSFNSKDYGLKTMDYKIVANIPYYITGQLFKMFLETDTSPSEIVFMAQKEVVKRIVARDKKESILSISVKIYGTPKYIKKVPAKLFSPAPKVDSAILLIENIKSPFKNKKEEKKFFTILKKGFSHKRKLLKSNLGCSEEILESCKIPTSSRPENLTVKDWLCLTCHI